MSTGVRFRRAAVTVLGGLGVLAPAAAWATGFTDITDTDRATLMAFWDTVQGGSNSFTWVDPITSNIYLVRFTETIERQAGWSWALFNAVRKLSA